MKTKNREQPIIVEQIFVAPITKVWSALTTLSEMKMWFFTNIKAFEPIAGFETNFDIQVEDRNFPHFWKVLEVQPNHKITTEWRYGGYQGCAIVEFKITQIDKQTHLKLTATTTESFPDDIPEFKIESAIDGWNYLIKKSLKDYLENN
jgi:uncharacterized protein YndB with AHSA1/START domain